MLGEVMTTLGKIAWLVDSALSAQLLLATVSM